VRVVHHPRTGACVLCYQSRAARSDATTLYGKVYPDGTGAVVDDFLHALCGHRGVDGLARFPTPVGYDPALRLLLTEALPGQASVPRLLKESVGASAKQATLRAAVHASGRALAGLHGTDLSTAPVRPAATELFELRREIAVMARAWPSLATAIGRQVDVLDTLDPGPAVSDLVLSHGDFTPSQVLLDSGIPAVVDLDTLCWADPALDLGRYLAQLRLLGAKLAGADAEPLLADLTDTFLAGYGEVSARSAAAAAASDRIRFYAATSLVRSALHGARQLKGYRLELAMSLLARRDAGRVAP
jgi:aminoglycoside phosphotransferase (APT) family kinase protein